MDRTKDTALENAHLLIQAITGAIAKGCVHRNAAGELLPKPLDVLNALRGEGGVFVEDPSKEVTERLEFTKRLYPKDTCYRNRGDARHHFRIHSYDVGHRHACDEPGCTHTADPTVVTVTLIHGSDSSLPGVAASGFDPRVLVACGCGLWKMPSNQQIAATKARIERMRRGGR